MSRLSILFVLFTFLACTSTGQNAEDKIKVLIVDGINNHDWKNTTIATKATLESTGRFTVDVSTTPGRRASKEEWAAWSLETGFFQL